MERPVKCVMVSDGVYKYVYVDTGEDVEKATEPTVETILEQPEIKEY